MTPANPDRSAMRSKLARVRADRNLSQQQLATLSGVSLRTLMRLERKEADNPPLRYLVNLSLVLRCRLSDLIEDEMARVGRSGAGGAAGSSPAPGEAVGIRPPTRAVRPTLT